MKKLVHFLFQNRKLIIITFELFWIIVFILDLSSNQSGTSIPQFVYVNF